MVAADQLTKLWVEISLSIGESRHVDSVTDDDAVESKLFSQQLRDDASGYRGGFIFIKMREEDMSGHNGGDTGIDGGVERRKLYLSYRLQIPSDYGQAEM